MAVKIAPNPKASSTGASITKTNILAKKQAQAINLEAFSTNVDRIHQIEQIHNAGAMLNLYADDGNFKVLQQPASLIKDPKPYCCQSHLKYLYPKHTFW